MNSEEEKIFNEIEDFLKESHLPYGDLWAYARGNLRADWLSIIEYYESEVRELCWRHKALSEDERILKEIEEFLKENPMSYHELWAYAYEHHPNDWLPVWDKPRNPTHVKMLCRAVAYDAAVKRNNEYYQWCQDNGYDIWEGLEHIPPEHPEWERISFRSLQVLMRRSRYETLRRKEKERPAKPHSRKAKKVRCLTDGKEFPSINKAAEYYGIRRTQDISDCCYGYSSSVNGYKFEFVKEEEE